MNICFKNIFGAFLEPSQVAPVEHFHYKVVAAGTVWLASFVSLWIHYACAENCEGRTGAIGALLLQTTFLKIAWSDQKEQRHDTMGHSYYILMAYYSFSLSILSSVFVVHFETVTLFQIFNDVFPTLSKMSTDSPVNQGHSLLLSCVCSFVSWPSLSLEPHVLNSATQHTALRNKKINTQTGTEQLQLRYRKPWLSNNQSILVPLSVFWGGKQN